jgi:hypothetical protein
MKEATGIVLFRIDRKVGLLMLGALAVAFGGFALADQLSLTTSYPVPSGIYNQLITTGNSGTVPADTTLNRNAGNTILVPHAGGMVGIGTASPGVALEVNGEIKATDIILTSDARRKMEILPLENSLAKLERLRGVSFKWRASGKPDTGVVAQDVRKVFPELVVASRDGSLGVKYASLIGPIVSAIDELASRWRTQDERIARFEAENRLLRQELTAVKKDMASLKIPAKR